MPFFKQRGDKAKRPYERREDGTRASAELVAAAFDTPLREPGDPHPLHGENYEPVFPRLSVTRRVLGHITPEVDRDDLGPRNTLHALTVGLISDPHTEISYPEQVPPYLDALVEAGLVSEADGVYTVTDAGWRELAN